MLRRADRIPIGDCCVTARTEKTWVPRELSLMLSLLVLGATSGDIGHALAGATWHGFETTIATATGGPADSNTPDPVASHLATDCPLCRVGRGSSTALNGRTTWFTAVGDRSYAVFLPQTLAPAASHPRTNAARAPPTPLST